MFAAEQTQIENIKFVNMDENSHDITVVVESQGETVFETVQEVPPYDETQPVLTYDDGIPTDTARYTVRAEVDSGSDSIERTYPTEYNGGDCYTVTVRIDQNGTPERSLVMEQPMAVFRSYFIRNISFGKHGVRASSLGK